MPQHRASNVKNCQRAHELVTVGSSANKYPAVLYLSFSEVKFLSFLTFESEMDRFLDVPIVTNFRSTTASALILL